MVRQVRQVPRSHPTEPQIAGAKPEQFTVTGSHLCGDEARAVVHERYQPLVEQRVQVDGEQEAIVDVESLIIRSVAPGLRVTRAEQRP